MVELERADLESSGAVFGGDLFQGLDIARGDPGIGTGLGEGGDELAAVESGAAGEKGDFSVEREAIKDVHGVAWISVSLCGHFNALRWRPR